MNRGRSIFSLMLLGGAGGVCCGCSRESCAALALAGRLKESIVNKLIRKLHTFALFKQFRLLSIYLYNMVLQWVYISLAHTHTHTVLLINADVPLKTTSSIIFFLFLLLYLFQWIKNNFTALIFLNVNVYVLRHCFYLITKRQSCWTWTISKLSFYCAPIFKGNLTLRHLWCIWCKTWGYVNRIRLQEAYVYVKTSTANW